MAAHRGSADANARPARKLIYPAHDGCVGAPCAWQVSVFCQIVCVWATYAIRLWHEEVFTR
jgi:hypothetical protein